MNKQTKDAQSLLGFAIALVTGSPSEAIETIEKIEQSDFLNKSILPVEGNWDILEAWGVKKLDTHDDLFFNCILPEGWTKEALNHYWSYLNDEKGRRRATIFYKGVIYDRRAHFHVSHPRCCVNEDFGNNLRWFYIKDFRTENIVWQSDKFAIISYRSEEYLKAKEIAKAKLEELYPDHDNPLAYWD